MTDDEKAKRTELLKRIVDRAKLQDTFAAWEDVEAEGSPLEVADLFSTLVQHCYYQEKDVPLMVACGRSGIAYCLRQAADAADEDAGLKLRGLAKVMAFNTSVNCWPAWEDDGISITQSDIACGLDVARLNLRLAEELQRDDEVFGGAHWLLGAQLLADKQLAAAAEQFCLAEQRYDAADKEDARQMAAGYRGIARLLNGERQDGQRELAAARQELDQLGTDDAKFYSAQLASVAKFFTR